MMQTILQAVDNMGNLLLIEAAVAGATILAAALVGRFLQKGCGTWLFALLTAVACALCIVGTSLAGWIGLVIAVLLVAVIGWFLGKKLSGARSASLVVALWLAFCLACVIGYWAAGGIGLATITLPATILFWGLLYLLSAYLLPTRDEKERALAFRSLLTFSIGTNYPFYVVENRELKERVPGNPYRSFFAGPGVILTGSDHLAVLTDGNNIQIPPEPGMAFTHRFDVIHRVVDLRPQLRAFFVEACTLDGINIRVLTFIPFRIRRSAQKPAEGNPLPYESRAVFKAVTNEPIEERPARAHCWDELPEIHATQILRDIVARYKFDDLCLALGPCIQGPNDIFQRYAADGTPSPHDPEHDPRYRIRDEMVRRLRIELEPFGIELVGGGISNLLPIDDTLVQQRIENWRTKWQSRIKEIEADRDAIRVEQIDGSRLGVDQALLVTVAELLSQSVADGKDMSAELVAASYVASLERMAENPNVREMLTHDTQQKIAYLRSIGRPMLISDSSTRGSGA